MKRIAVVGFGFMGVVHAKNIINSEDLELCGIIDNRNSDIFANIESTGNHGDLALPMRHLKATPIFRDLEQCTAEAKPDAVVICVPLLHHYELTRKSLELGLDVLLEKPFCQELLQGHELIGRAEEKRLILMVGHCVRFSPPWEFLAACVQDKRYGELHLLTTSRMAGEPTWGVWRDKEIKKTCGGSLFDLLIHDIDFISYCLGQPTDVQINLRRDEYWELAFNHNSTQATVSVRGGFLHQHTPFTSDYAATFDRGGIRFSSHESNVIHIATEAGVEPHMIEGDPYVNELKYFSQCIQSRQSPIRCLPLDSLQTIELCQKIEQESSFS